mmetsp:Transcript_34712/g.109625  ORF Transcript_34712/g.109625 Transcript_34712/m.109625 type:complete len:306 (+) Transcript_34712:184-1101(+)
MCPRRPRRRCSTPRGTRSSTTTRHTPSITKTYRFWVGSSSAGPARSGASISAPWRAPSPRRLAPACWSSTPRCSRASRTRSSGAPVPPPPLGERGMAWGSRAPSHIYCPSSCQAGGRPLSWTRSTAAWPTCPRSRSWCTSITSRRRSAPRSGTMPLSRCLAAAPRPSGGRSPRTRTTPRARVRGPSAACLSVARPWTTAPPRAPRRPRAARGGAGVAPSVRWRAQGRTGTPSGSSGSLHSSSPLPPRSRSGRSSSPAPARASAWHRSSPRRSCWRRRARARASPRTGRSSRPTSGSSTPRTTTAR